MTFPFLVCRMTSYKLHELTPDVLLEAARSFARYPHGLMREPKAGPRG